MTPSPPAHAGDYNDSQRLRCSFSFRSLADKKAVFLFSLFLIGGLISWTTTLRDFGQNSLQKMRLLTLWRWARSESQPQMKYPKKTRKSIITWVENMLCTQALSRSGELHRFCIPPGERSGSVGCSTLFSSEAGWSCEETF